MPTKDASKATLYVMDMESGKMIEITEIQDITAEFKKQDNFCPEQSVSYEPHLQGGTVTVEVNKLSRAQFMALFGSPSYFGITNNWLRMHHYPMVRRKRRKTWTSKH